MTFEQAKAKAKRRAKANGGSVLIRQGSKSVGGNGFDPIREIPTFYVYELEEENPLRHVGVAIVDERGRVVLTNGKEV